MKITKLSGNAVRPAGWLERQLRLQADGLTGNIGRLFFDLSDDNAWLGGNGEAWERGPYYLDGLVPLAFLLDDAALIAKARQWVEAILSSENDYVGFGPKRSVDWWPRFVALKALESWHHFTKDERVVPFFLRYFRYMKDNLAHFPLKYWAQARYFECFSALELAYEVSKEEFLLELADQLHNTGFDWVGMFEDFKYKKPMTKYTSKFLFNLGKAIAEPLDAAAKKSLKIPKKESARAIEKFNNMKMVSLIMGTHGVNLAMALKYPAAYGKFRDKSGLLAATEKGFKALDKHHGTATMLHTCDEHIMGASPAQGIELCTVAEMMYTAEELFRLTGDVKYADYAEFLCFNALPATFTDDMCAHQYVQQPNQIAADVKKRQFFDVNKEANIFGVEPNYGCCAANMHQAFPKFAASAAVAAEDDAGEMGLCFPVFAPVEIDCEIDGKRYHVAEETNYPFSDKITFRVLCDIPDGRIFLKIPEGVKDIAYNQKPQNISLKDEFAVIKADFKQNDVIEINLNPAVKLVKNSDGSASVRRGNLLFALPLHAKETFVRGEKPFHYRAFNSDDRWSYGLSVKDKNKFEKEGWVVLDGIQAEFFVPADKPFSKTQPTAVLEVDAFEVENWQKKKNSAAPYPKKLKKGKAVKLKLVPYGGTLLRITQFPI